MPRATKFHEKGYSYLVKDPDLVDWDFCYHIHKNQNGTHFDLRLYCPTSNETVYSCSSKKHLLDKAFRLPVRRTKDHKVDWMTYEGEYETKKGKNILKIIESGPAKLIDVAKDHFIFSTEHRVFKLKHLRGKKYLYCPLQGLVK